jgi:chromosome segregation ATPase
MTTLQDSYLEQLGDLQKRLDDTLARLASHGVKAAPHRAKGEELQRQRADLQGRLGGADDRPRAARAATSDLHAEFHELSKTAENWIKSIDQGFYG